MADAAQIGANFSDYTGDQALGGGTFGVAKLDTRPIEDLGRYIMLYNKAEYDQRQKDAERDAAEIADLTRYDLTSSIPKDSQHLQNRFDEFVKFVRDNPDALNYNNRAAWAEYNQKKSELKNDIRGGTVRKLLYDVRTKEIADETNPELKALRQQRLDEEVAAKDIRTPLLHSQKYDTALPKLPTPQEQKFDVYRTGPNSDINREYSMWNVGNARAQGNVYGLDLEEVVDETTPEGKEKAIARRGNFYIQGAEQLNQVISQIKDPNTGAVDKSKLKGMSRQLIGLVDKTNDYLDKIKNEIKAGVYKDKFGKPITFGEGLLNEDDYARINYEDGISPDELALIASFAQWQGDSYKTKTIETDDAIQREQLQNQRRGQDMENARFWAGLNAKNDEDLISADSVIKEFSDVVRQALPAAQVDVKADAEGNIGSRKKVRDIFYISDPNIFKEFGTIDKDGKTTNVPDNIYLDKNKNNFDIVFYKKDDNGNILKTKTGNSIIDRTVSMTPTQYLGQIVRRKFPNKDIGGVNNLVDAIYNKYGRNIQKMVDAYPGGATATTGSSSSSSAVSGGTQGLDPNGFKKEGNYWRYSDGRLFDENGNVIQNK